VLLQGTFVELLNWQAEKQVNTPLQLSESPHECLALRLIVAVYDSGVFNAPMRRDGLAGPQGTGFSRGIVTHGDYEVELWRIGSRKLVPTLAP
jgi:hypothetical protein